MNGRMLCLIITFIFVCMSHMPLNASDDQAKNKNEARTVETEITWDFEKGNLRGWTATGEAFSTQPTLGDNPTARDRGQPSRHEGQYWIGTYENRRLQDDTPGRIQGDQPQGMLTSGTFVISHPVITFLIGGGCDLNTEKAELLLDGAVHLQATGKCTETMERRCWDVSSLKGRVAQIRLVDSSSGPWGHINFDDVRFAGNDLPDVKAVMDSEKCVPDGAAASKTGSGSGTQRQIRTYKTIRIR